MTKHSAQLHRIREKLKAARDADRSLDVFGAEKHRYKLNPPISTGKLATLEDRAGVTLPEDLRAFSPQLIDARRRGETK